MKGIKILFLLLIIFLPSCFGDCKDGHSSIKIVNNSDIRIGFSDWITQDIIYNYEVDFYACMRPISANSFIDFFCLDGNRIICWENVLNKGKTIHIFFVDIELYEQYWKQPFDTLLKYVPVLHCYRLKLEDLQRMNWTVVYPPEESDDTD